MPGNRSAERLRPRVGDGAAPNLDLRGQLAADAARLIEQYVRQGVTFSEAWQIIGETLEAVEQKSLAPCVVFAECNQYQVEDISELLTRELRVEVKPMLVADLATGLPPLTTGGKEVSVITTGFHVSEVRKAVGDLPARIDVLITNLSPETRRRLEAVGEDGRYSFICRDPESALLYQDLLKAELGFGKMRLTCCTLDEADRVREILSSSDVVLTSPPVYREVKRLAPPGKTVYNVFDRVDPMSLKVVAERILGRGVTGQGPTAHS